MLAVNDIYLAIQGEGTYTGVPMILIRLQGCDVGCKWCDTKETWKMPDMNVSDRIYLPKIESIRHLNDVAENWALMEEEWIVNFCRKTYPDIKWIMLTGGEPILQDVSKLTDLLMNNLDPYNVLIETSGTEFDGLKEADWTWLCVSPKLESKKPLNANTMAVANEIKFPIGNEGDIAMMEPVIKEFNLKSQFISVQPISQDKEATRICVAAALEHGWRLSIQIHKYLGLS